jgi:phosphoribosylformylglycinamidine cyclo-ligase
VLIGLGSSGLHSNGYSLVRHVLFEQGKLGLDATPELLQGRTLADELLEPTRIYAQDCLALAAECDAHAFAHINGGGLAGNLVRVLPTGLGARVDRGTWAPQPIFDLVARTGEVSQAQLELTFNLGVGMIAVVPEGSADAALTLAGTRGLQAWRLGEIVDGDAVTLTGDYLGDASNWR